MQYFTEEDRREALKTSGTGMWRLESGDGLTPRFYGDSYMNMLLGVSDDTSPEDRFNIFMSRIYEEDRNMFMEYYNSLKEMSQAEVVYRYVHPELGIIYVRCGGKKSSSDGNIHCYRGFHQNVNNTLRVEQESKKRLTQKAELYRTVAFKMMQNFSDATARINIETGDFEWLSFDGENPENHIRYDDLFRDISVNVPEDHRGKFITNASLHNIKKQLSEKDVYSFSSFIHRPEDGELRRVTYWYYSVDENRKYALSIYKDTTDDYIIEKQLEEALLEAKKANEAKTAFLNNMSHEIRTPMNAIIGFTELAQKHIEDEERSLGYLEKIKTSSKHLLTLINDVLDMSRIESGRMQIVERPCSLIEVSDALYTILQTDAEKKGIDYKVDCNITNPFVMCDDLRLNQVLLNCASNALKFTRTGGKVSITVCQNENPYLPDGFGEYQFIIEDTGIGMSQEFVEKVFEPFTREENAVHQIQGTGLGMTISKNIIDMMGGEILVKSKVGVGTQFTITIQLKLTDGVETQEKTNTEDSYSIQGKRILLAEDNDLNREIATEILTEHGAIVETAENGKIAVDMVSESDHNYYDLILMDVQMPIMNGYEATGAIRSLEREDVASMVIIAMTANAFEEDKQHAIAAGMNGHLAKPIDVAEMMKTFHKFL